MICSSRRDLGVWSPFITAVLYEHFPLIVRVSKTVEVKRNEVVKKDPFNLTTKYKNS